MFLFPFCSGHNDLIIDQNGPRRIDCGLKGIDASKYKRNYVVNDQMNNNFEDSLNFKWNTEQVAKSNPTNYYENGLNI